MDDSGPMMPVKANFRGEIEMPEIEYKSIPRSKERRMTEDELNELAKLGWELTGILAGDWHTMTSDIYYFKRTKEPENV